MSDNLHSDLAAHCMKLEKQRDELLTAMKNIRPFIEEGDVPERFWSEPFKTALSDFDAAIAKCKIGV